MNSNREYIGTCTECGEENVRLTVVDEVNHLCQDCLDTDYFQCDDCMEYWHYDFVELFHLKDGRVVCMHCREDYEDEEIDFDF